nr:putative ribonuclease H-like domain-containing protein [Tanacetum cinerariifolium]
LGQEWYFDLDYLTDSLGYTRFKTNPPVSTQDTNIITGIQNDDSEFECDEQAILVPSFPSNCFLGPKVHDVSTLIENNFDYTEELARLQKQEHEAHSTAAKNGFEFSNKTAKMLHQDEIKTRRNLVIAAGDPAGSIVSTGGVPVGSVPAGNIPTSSVPTRSVPTCNVPAGAVLAGSIDSAGFGDPAASESVLVVFNPDHGADSPLPSGHSLGSSEHSTRFPSPSDLGNHQPTAGIFSSFSYDDDFCADVTNLALSVAVDTVATKRVNTIHPQSQIIGELQSPILKNKRDARGIVFRNKAILVAQGHRQEEGIDYDEVFALVARIKAIRLFLAFASYMGFMVYQMDVKSVFLYGEIEEEVYVTQPKGFKDPHNPKHVYRVVIALYGLHQAPRAWFMWMTLSLVPRIKPGVLSLSQDKYVNDMLKKFDMESVRTATTSYEVPKHKSKDEPDDAVNVHLNRSMIGSLMYLTASRPDIMFVVIACSRHQVTPMTSHLHAVKKIFKYLKGQPNLGLWYPRDSPFQLEAYRDSDYAGSYGDRKSTTGGCQFMGRRLISWQCKKQTVIATSSTEAEYVSAASCCGQDQGAWVLLGRVVEVMGSSRNGGDGLGNRERGVMERWQEIRLG